MRMMMHVTLKAYSHSDEANVKTDTTTNDTLKIVIHLYTSSEGEDRQKCFTFCLRFRSVWRDPSAFALA